MTKPHLRLVSSKPAVTAKRPYTTDYGTSQGHCATQQAALRAAVCYLINNGTHRCTIEGADGVLARVQYLGFWGLLVTPARKSRKT